MVKINFIGARRRNGNATRMTRLIPSNRATNNTDIQWFPFLDTRRWWRHVGTRRRMERKTAQCANKEWEKWEKNAGKEWIWMAGCLALAATITPTVNISQMIEAVMCWWAEKDLYFIRFTRLLWGQRKGVNSCTSRSNGISIIYFFWFIFTFRNYRKLSS